MTEQDIDPHYQSGVVGVEHRNIDASGDEHPFGDSPKEWEADLRPLLRSIANDLYESWEATVREYLANAETACLKVERFCEDPEIVPWGDMIVPESSYSGQIEVTWDRSEQKLIIRDNGIGMAAVEVDEVFRYISRSAARDIGAMSGSFGMGAISFPKFIGTDKTMIMTSHSRLNDDNASYLVTLAGIEPIRGSMPDDQYGTEFRLDQKHDDMEVRQAVERYAEWMRVPVLYREIDETGTEVFNEDWGDRHLYDDYGDSVYVDKFEVPGAFEAYMSADVPNDPRTLLLSMPIERNDTSSTSSPYPYDIRILDESGAVVWSENGNEGLMPIDDVEYERMLLQERPDHITEAHLDSQDIVATTVTSERADYAVEGELLDDDTPLPRAEYVALDSTDADERGEREVIIGPHSGRTVVDDATWQDLPQGRAERFVPRSDLGDGDICLPQPTTDRSSLQANPEFWERIDDYFSERFDDTIVEWHHRLEQSDDLVRTIDDLEPRTKAEVVADAR